MYSFSIACRDGNFDEVTTMLETYKLSRTWLLQLREANGWNCLEWTAWYNDIACMRYLLTLKELDITTKDLYGRSVLHIALQPPIEQVFHNQRGRLGYPRQPCYEIVKMLLEANTDVVDCSDARRIIASALMSHHIDVVKLLIDSKSFVAYGKDIFWHIAAECQRVDCMRYLLSKPDYDRHIIQLRDRLDRQPYFIFFQSMLRNRSEPLIGEIEFGVELLLLTVKSPVDTVDVYFILIDCFTYYIRNIHNDNRVRVIFMEIVELILPQHPQKNLVDKILNAELPCDFSLVIIILFGRKNEKRCQLAVTFNRYEHYLDDVKRHLLLELFTLYLADESLFVEIIAEVIRVGWTFNPVELLAPFCAALTAETSRQTLFDFTKRLIFHKFDVLVRPSTAATITTALQSRLEIMDDYLLNVFVPLSNYVHAPIELMKLRRQQVKECHFNFNESENCINDYYKLSHEPDGQFAVVSLKNLSRMSVRKQLFAKHSYYDALSTMYNLDIPMELRQFLCYNHSNLKF